MTIMEKKGDPRGLTINVSYAYASSYQKPISVPQSLILLMPRFGIDVTLACPPEFRLMPEIEEQAKAKAEQVREGISAALKGGPFADLRHEAVQALHGSADAGERGGHVLKRERAGFRATFRALNARRGGLTRFADSP